VTGKVVPAAANTMMGAMVGGGGLWSWLFGAMGAIGGAFLPGGPFMSMLLGGIMGFLGGQIDKDLAKSRAIRTQMAGEGAAGTAWPSGMDATSWATPAIDFAAMTIATDRVTDGMQRLDAAISGATQAARDAAAGIGVAGTGAGQLQSGVGAGEEQAAARVADTFGRLERSARDLDSGLAAVRATAMACGEAAVKVKAVSDSMWNGRRPADTALVAEAL
jgi:hypothetical protein